MIFGCRNKGVTRVERVDRLIKGLALGHGMKNDDIIRRVDSALATNNAS